MKPLLNKWLIFILMALFLITLGVMGWSVSHVCFLLFFTAMLVFTIRFFHFVTHNKYNDTAEDA